MDVLDTFAVVVRHFASPFSLIGVAIFVFIGVHPTLIRSGILKSVSAKKSSPIFGFLQRYRAWIAFLLIMVGFGFAPWKTHLAANAKVDVDAIVDTLTRKHAAELEMAGKRIEEARGQLQAMIEAVSELARQSAGPGASAGVKDALRQLVKGDTRAAERIFEEALDRREAKGMTPLSEAAAARHLGALAFLRDLRKAREAYRKATRLDPKNEGGWLGLGNSAASLGLWAEAEDAFRQYLSLLRRTGSDGAILTGHREMGDVLLAQGKRAAALESYRSGIAVAEQLAAEDPRCEIWQSIRSEFYDRIGDVLVAQGEEIAALKHYRAGMAITVRLAMLSPGNPLWQRDVWLSYDRIGDVLLAQGKGTAALENYRAGLAIAERLTASDPGVAVWQRELSVSHNKIGDVLAASGELAAALESYRAGRAIREHLSASDLRNVVWQRDLSISHGRIGDVLLAQGNGAAALESYRSAMAIAARLAASDPGNTTLWYDLSISHNKIGDVLTARGELAAALENYRAGMDIAARIVKSDPGNADWQRNLAVSFWRLAGYPGSDVSWSDVARVFEDLNRRDILTPGELPYLTEARRRASGKPPQ